MSHGVVAELVANGLSGEVDAGRQAVSVNVVRDGDQLVVTQTA